MTDLTARLAAHATSVSCEALPKAVVEQAKQVIFDEIASAHFGRRSIAGTLATRYVDSARGLPEAQVFGSGFKTSAALAAMANGAAGHGEEIDGAHTAGGHPGSVVVNAAMALGEARRKTGADVIAAVVAGYDVGVRLRWACGGSFHAREKLHLHADFLYALGAAAAAGRLMNLDARAIGHALALTTLQANGLYAIYAEQRHVSKSFCEGLYAHAGISGAQMAAAGLEGHADIVGARSGVLEAWGVDGGRDIVIEGLGRSFSIMNACFKFFNAGFPIQAALEAALALVRDHAIDAADIGSVTVAMNPSARRIVDSRAMNNICLQDMLAAVLLGRGASLGDDPFPAMLSDPRFRRLRDVITIVDDARFRDDAVNRLGAELTISRGRAGRVSRVVDHSRGYDAQGRIDWQDLEQKWRENLGGCDVSRAIAIARDLEYVEDVSLLAGCFGGP
ncbi:MAG: MmgE/PrpD family protein [Burkholderiaceae bacterium]